MANNKMIGPLDDQLIFDAVDLLLTGLASSESRHLVAGHGMTRRRREQMRRLGAMFFGVLLTGAGVL